MQIIEQPGNILGQVGRGFLEGVGEQLPKEVERSRLAKGIESLKFKKNLTPLEQSAHLLRNGVSPEHLQQFLPLIQQAQQLQGFKGLAEGKTPVKEGATSTTSPVATPLKPNEPEKPILPSEKKRAENGFASPKEIQEYKQSLKQFPEQKDVYNKAQEFIDMGVTLDPNEAIKLAGTELAQNREAEQKRIANFRNDLDKDLKLILQGEGLGDFKDLTGKIQKDLLDQGELLVKNKGLTPEAATQKISSIAEDLGLTMNNLKQTGSWANMFRKAATKTQELKAQRKEFEKYGYEEQFDNMAAAQMGVTPLEIAHRLDPLKNKNIENKIESLKKATGLTGIPKVAKMPEKVLDEIVTSIKPEDNLYAIEYLLRQKFYDINQFKQRVDELAEQGKIKLEKQQERQNKRAVDNNFFGDILYESF